MVLFSFLWLIPILAGVGLITYAGVTNRRLGGNIFGLVSKDKSGQIGYWGREIVTTENILPLISSSIIGFINSILGFLEKAIYVVVVLIIVFIVVRMIVKQSTMKLKSRS